MFFKKGDEKKAQKAKKPGPVPDIVQSFLVSRYNMPAHLTPLLKAVVRKNAGADAAFDIRVYDDSEAQARKIQISDYNTLDAQPVLTLYEGLFNEKSKQVDLQEKKKVDWNPRLFSEVEIMDKIEALNQTNHSVFFYTARGSAHGGPLGMGAAVIEYNAQGTEKKQKKYDVYFSDVIDGNPVAVEQKLFSSDKAKEIARWIKDAHHQRMY